MTSRRSFGTAAVAASVVVAAVIAVPAARADLTGTSPNPGMHVFAMEVAS